MAPRTFLHAADLHLDSPLLSLDLGDDEEARSIVRGATREAFVRLVDRALARRVAFVVLAGDLWDGTWQDVRTGLWFVRETARLAQANIPVVFLRGNHDAESEVTAALPWPPHVHELPTDAPGTVRLQACRVALHGQGFADRRVTANLALSYPPPVPGWLNVGVLHTALDGSDGHAPYAPCTVADLGRRGYDYWALGHVHGFKVHDEAPWIVHPGCIQGRHANETGAKGAVEVDFDDDRIVAVRRVALNVVRWERPVVDVADATSAAEVEHRVHAALVQLAAELVPGERLLVVRPTLVGTTPAAADLLADRRGLAARLAARAAVLTPRTVIETLAWQVEPPRRDAPLGDDAVADLARRLDRLATDPAMLAELDALVATIDGRVPPDVLARLRAGPLAALFAGDRAGFLLARRTAADALLGTTTDGDAAG